jgi:RND family efflux transporter MFP subunit
MKFSGKMLAGAAIGLVTGAVLTGVAVNMSSGGGSGGGPGSGGGFRGGYAPVVTMTTAEEASITRTIDVIGEARALKSVAITSEVTGIVEEVNIAPGKRVEQGDVLLRADDDEQQIALSRAEAEYPIARENAERYTNLRRDESASAQEAEQAVNNYNQVRAELRAAEFAVEQRIIRAPFDGISGLTDIEVGDYIRAGDVITTLDDTSSVIIEFAVPQEAAGFVNVGQPVTASLTSAAAAKYEGEISAIDSRVDTVSRTLKVEAKVQNDEGRLIPGAVLAVSTTSEGEKAVAVPGLAVQWDRSGAFVWRRGPDGSAQRAGVVILQRTDEMVLVEGDVEDGDVIVSEGADRVRNGVPLPALENNGSEVSAASAGAAASQD